MSMSRTRTILSLSLVTASLGVGGMTLASPGRNATAAKTAPQRAKPAPATPLVTSNGRPACGNTLGKRTLMEARTALTTDLAALAKLVKTNADDDQPTERDALIASIRAGLDQIETCRDELVLDAWPGDDVTAR